MEAKKAAAILGHIGGRARSGAKAEAARKNGRLGGRPTWRELAERRVRDTPELTRYESEIMYDWNDQGHWPWVVKAPVAEIVDWAETVRRQQDV